MQRFLIYLVLLVQMLFAGIALAAPAIPAKPANNIYVQDYAGVISQADKQQILSIGQDLDKKTTAQVAVITVNSLEGQPIEDYALAVLRNWGIGTKEKNNGVLIVVAIKDRSSRIEVGYGLEGVLPDGKTGRIQDEYMLPYFKQNDYSKGILQGYKATASTIAKSEGVKLSAAKAEAAPQAKQKSSDSSWDNIFYALAIIGFLLIDNLFLGGIFTQMLLWLLFFGGRGGGGRGGGFGGGSGGGGGSSRSW